VSCSEVDEESRPRRPGVVYRILDNGEVVCESHPEETEPNGESSSEDNSGPVGHPAPTVIRTSDNVFGSHM